jgi:hypothetical protein
VRYLRGNFGWVGSFDLDWMPMGSVWGIQQQKCATVNVHSDLGL